MYKFELNVFLLFMFNFPFGIVMILLVHNDIILIKLWTQNGKNKREKGFIKINF